MTLALRSAVKAAPPPSELGTILPLRLADVTFEAGGQTIIDRLSHAFEAGPRTVILGPNGAGKSVTLRLCHGLLAPTAGTVAWARPAREARLRQAMVFQRPVLLRRSASANVEHALALHGVRGRERAERAAEALALARIAELADRPARKLSGGEQQRLALARAWALRPDVLFLDEPTSNLDPAATRSVEAVIEAIHAQGAKIVMTTHDLGQARRLADEVLFLHHGRLIEHGPADRFFAGPRTPEARAFLAGELLW